MEDAHIGWLAAIIIGGIAGWLAEIITRSNMGILTNIVLGVIGAALASWLFGKLGIQVGGPNWVGYCREAVFAAEGAEVTGETITYRWTCDLCNHSFITDAAFEEIAA